MKRIILLLLLVLSCIQTGQAQLNLSNTAEISILTVGPGRYLYDKFGHSAFRVQDPALGVDMVFNYGTYDFNTPNFYGKFAKGELLYSLSTSGYAGFYRSYVYQERWIKEQKLDLNSDQKQALFEYLQWNALPENKDYRYDFLFDNCATRIRDVLVEALGEDLKYDMSYAKAPYTYRQLIQQHVHWNSWGSLGMDIGIGAVTDRIAPAWDYQFLPDYVAQAAATADLADSTGVKPLVKQEEMLYTTAVVHDNSGLMDNPFLFFILIGLVLVVITVIDARRQKRSRYLDGGIFLLTGIVGSILLFLWFGTQHTTTADNYNLLWGFPLSLLLVPLISRKQPPKWLARYSFWLVLMLALMVFHQLSGVQQFAPALTPLLVGLAIRYLYLWKTI